MKVFLGLILGMAIAIGAIWYLGGQKTATDSTHPNSVASTGSSDDKLTSFKLHTEDIKEDLAKTGRVIRDKAKQAGDKIVDAAADTKVTATIKSKLVADPDLSAWDISVHTTDGVVTLSGTVSSEENIGKAMLLAIETDGVQQVVSSLQVKTKA